MTYQIIKFLWIFVWVMPYQTREELLSYKYNGYSALNSIVLPAYGHITYNYTLNKTVEYVFVFSNLEISSSQPSRITVECSSSDPSFPILVVVRQQKGVLSWQLPLRVQSQNFLHSYNRTSRTLCPDNNYYEPNENSELIVGVSTSSMNNVYFSLLVQLEKNFTVGFSDEMTVHVSPAEPRYFSFKFLNDGRDTVLLRVDSPDDLCMTVSIQNISCPVFDLEKNVLFEGYWQSMSRRGGITLTKKSFPLGFYIVFVVKADDWECSGSYATLMEFRNKLVTFSVSPSITYQDYIVATIAALVALSLFYLFSIIVGVIYFIRKRNNSLDDDLPDDRSVSSPGLSGESRNTVESDRVCFSNSDSSLDETDIDMLQDADSEKDIFRTKQFLSVADLARKDPRILRKKSQLYLWNLLTVAVFYSLPVVQLVLTYQLVSKQTGNQDLCYYNFLCSHPLGLLSDFNHIFSNIGYVLLGLLFIGLTYRREILHRQAGRRLDKLYGIPQHYGLFYAMGASLIMEGILSGCYHVCPNHSNFQFDTSFMYVISMLCMVKIYQTRHPDINASAYATFGVLAIVIFIGMFGVLEGTLSFWVIFTVVHLVICLIVSAQIYYMGRWKFDFGVYKRVRSVIINDFRSNPRACFRPLYPSRMVLLSLGNVCNWALAVYGLLYHLGDFATHLLMIFMANLMLYCIFYIVMKLCNHERILPQPLIYIILAFTTWVAALYFFLNKSISWVLTPAQSRAYNHPCEILDFYDKHDIWHFLSSASMFFSFMVLLTLDDDLIRVHRSNIPVF